MRWQNKARLQSVLSRLPGGETAYYLVQRHLTKTLPQSEEKFREVLEIENEHIDAYLRFCKKPIGEAVFYQFGAGWTMAGPLTFYCHGVNKQILVDIRRLIRPWLINLSAERLSKMEESAHLLRHPRPLSAKSPNRFVAEMGSEWGIDYRAPADARCTGLPDESIDCITSTNTLEHIPRQDIAEILVECHRILRPGGIMSFRVDYQDHYSYFDRSIGVYNFLQYAPTDWRSFNPSLHY
ncbi:MAG: class I SAM-dependent methyltransferase, partial [Planctomycetaceae bacterium]|nr:class I SAM-dependent methyltransferase [Planctomycetaceae bacterium]